MAYRKRRFMRTRSAYRSYRGFTRRSWSKQGRGGWKKWAEFGIGAAAGAIAPRFHPLQDSLIAIAAVLPIRMPRTVRTLLGGYVTGTVLRPHIAPVLGGIIPGANTSNMNAGIPSF